MSNLQNIAEAISAMRLTAEHRDSALEQLGEINANLTRTGDPEPKKVAIVLKRVKNLRDWCDKAIVALEAFIARNDPKVPDNILDTRSERQRRAEMSKVSSPAA